MRVALIESRSRTQHDLLTMLAETGITTTDVNSSAELNAALGEGTLNAVIIGEPPLESKVELIRQVRRHPYSPRIAVIAIVADRDGPEAVTLIENGADDVVALPITAEDLGQTIRRSRWENTRELEAAELELRLIKPAHLVIEVFSQAHDGYFIAAESGQIIAASSGLERLTGFDAVELAGETIEGLGLALTPSGSTPLDENGSEKLELTIVTSDWRKVAVTAEIFEIRLAGVRCQFGIVREAGYSDDPDVDGPPSDIVTIHPGATSPHHIENLLDTIIGNSNDAMVVVDRSGRIKHISQGFERVLGWQVEALAGRNIIDFVAPEDYAIIQPFSTGGTVLSGAIDGVRLLQENGEQRTVTLNVTDLAQNPLVEGWMITIQAPANTVLHHTRRLGGGGFYSLYDPVTALPNRLLFIDRLDHAIERSARVHSVMCCIVASIDDLEHATRSCSPDVINQIFCEFCRRLHQTVREGDTVARIGDGDFAILAEGVGGVAEARMLGERVVEVARETFDTPAGPIRLKASVGAAISTPTGQNAGNLLRDANQAMEYGRKMNSGRCVVFEDRMRDAVIDSLRLDDDLENVQERGELQIFYQPEVDIKADTVLAAEALVRWEHPRHGLILPGEFLALAEETGRLDAIGLWIIESVCETVQGWRSRNPEASGVIGAVNLSARQIEREGFAEDVFEILNRTGLPGENLRLEVSEPQPSRVERWAEAARFLQTGGVRIGLQDISPSSLNTEILATMPIDTLKVDRTAMSAIIEDPARPSRSKPLAQFGAENDLNVIVSGIETAQHLARARILGFNHGQGFYFYRPVPPQTIEYLLMRSQQSDEEVLARAFQSTPLRASA
jgi:diguanylate cyclase (GGDEF)-like protein/PAS domain S-box-containing protein